MKTTAQQLKTGQTLKISTAWQTVHYAPILAVAMVGDRIAIAVRDVRDNSISILDFAADEPVIVAKTQLSPAKP